ncbi:MAG: response regulator [Leptospiraceae bacterium]|nr:response regulator [Leptospiraceae bacterium]MCP5500368.1 response regulator [Leptospiraceae bacterium]
MEKKKVLFVDDSGTMRTIVAQTLEMAEFTVLKAGDGKEGLSCFTAQKPDIVITDVNMPEMDGITFIKELRKLDPEIPILVLTTESKDSLKDEAFSSGANGWIVKPFRPAQIISMIKDILD